MQNLELSKEEIALIKAKRGNDLNLKKETLVKEAKEKIEEELTENQKEVVAYKKYLNDLNNANMSKGCGEIVFELEITQIKKQQVPYFYDGTERFNLQPIEYTIEKCEIKYVGETVKFQMKHMDAFDDGETYETNYHGNTPEEDGAYRVDAEYSISVSEHTTGSYHYPISQGFKMSIDGLSSTGNRSNGKNITNPKTVLKKILEDIELKKTILKAEENKRSLSERALKEVTKLFPNTKLSQNDKKIEIKFANSITLDVRYYDDSESESGVKLSIEKVGGLWNADAVELGNLLAKL
jgi:hypothetical protein